MGTQQQERFVLTHVIHAIPIDMEPPNAPCGGFNFVELLFCFIKIVICNLDVRVLCTFQNVYLPEARGMAESTVVAT